MSDQQPMTVAEQLDAARTGEEFGQVIMGLFSTLEKAMDEEMSTQSRYRRESLSEAGGYRYGTPAGYYTLTGAADDWVLSTPGSVVGRYATVEEAEAALDADVQNRMWN